MFNENHDGEIRCPYCLKYVLGADSENRCPKCHRILKKKCVICGDEFIKDDRDMRQCCFKSECYKVFREACGSSARFWRTENQIKMQERAAKQRRLKKLAKG